jgi:4-amino-4-deoxy-L-arabinose transferase-like glycosyltransferase
VGVIALKRSLSRVGVRDRPVVASVAAVALALVATRLVLLWRFPPFWDESLYAGWALQVHDSFAARWVALLNGKLPLLSWIGAGIMHVGFEPLTAVRLVSIASAIGSAVFAALIASEIGGPPAGIAAAAVYVILPLALVHDVVGLMEPLLAALFAASLYLQVRLARRPGLVTAAMLGLVFGAALLTKESSYLLLVLFPFSLVLFDWQAPERLRRLGRWAVTAALACGIAALAELLLASSGKLSVYRSTQQGFGTVRSLHAGLAHPIRWADQAWPGYRPEIVGYLTWPLALLALAGAAVALWRRQRLALLCALWILALFAIDVLFLTDAFVRYLVPAGPFVAVLVGVGFAEIVQAARRVPRIAGHAVLAAALVLAAVSAVAVRFDLTVLADPSTAAYAGVSLQEYETGWSAGTGVESLTAELRRLGRSHTAVVSWYGHLPPELIIELRNDRTVDLVSSDDHSSYVVTNDLPLPADAGLGTLRPLWTFQRPRNGVPLVVYERGVAWKGRFYTTADSLRSGLGLDDKHFDAFIAQHRRIRAWYVAVAS